MKRLKLQPDYHSKTQASLRMKQATHLLLQTLVPSFHKIVSLYARFYVTQLNCNEAVILNNEQLDTHLLYFTIRLL